MGHSLLREGLSASVAFVWLWALHLLCLDIGERFTLVIPVLGSCSVETLAFPLLTVIDDDEGGVLGCAG